MRLGFVCLLAMLVTGFLLSGLPVSALAQKLDSSLSVAAQLPQAPPQQPASYAAPQEDSAAQNSPGAQSSALHPGNDKNQREKAEEQIKEQEKQRVIGIIPAFNVSYRSDAVSMTVDQKMRLALRSSLDPVSFGEAFFVAGYHEAMDDNKGFGWGADGYGKRSGAAYLDAFNGRIISNGILPSILRQEPRYLRLGHGSITHRLLYSLASNVICKHDNSDRWEPNYSNVLGNIAAGGISNFYYPSSDSGAGQTFANGFIVTAEGGIGSIFQEFWPDVSRKFFHRDPTHGLDAQMRAAEQRK